MSFPTKPIATSLKIHALVAFALVTLSALAAAGQTFDVLKSFHDGGGNPRASLLQTPDGSFYGTTSGAGGYGSVFRLSADGRGGFTYTTVHAFSGADGANLHAAVIQGGDGNLYGTATSGGDFGFGTVFKVAVDGTDFMTLHSFHDSDGAYPYAAVVQGSDGSLYGTTSSGGDFGYGTVFKMAVDGTGFMTVHPFHNFDGNYPAAAVIQGGDGNLYGTTAYGGDFGVGTVFKMAADGTSFTTLRSFDNSDGSRPHAAVIQGGDGNLYGTTSNGGSGPGTVFKMAVDGTGFTTLHSFRWSDGANPNAAVIQGGDGNLYGTTSDGDGGGGGTVFKMTVDGTVFTTLHSFRGFFDGAHPNAAVIQGVDGNLYGTTTEGGSGGTIFKMAVDGTGFASISDGATLWYGVIQGGDGNLYGMTDSGGSSGSGTIFKMAADGTGFTTLHSSGGNALIQGGDGNVYGTTQQGGDFGDGAVFKMAVDGTSFTTLHSFDGADGLNPAGAVIQGGDGNLYGTTQLGGSPGCGTVFKMAVDGTGFMILHNFSCGAGGQNPGSAVIQGGDGNLYGTTVAGGEFDVYGTKAYGTVFKMGVDGTGFTTIHSFGSAEGTTPYAAVIQGMDRNLYGTTTHGVSDPQSGAGTIFKMAVDGTGFTTLHSFDGTDGAGPYAAVVQGRDGNLYGTTFDGGTCDSDGSYGCGTVFKIAIDGTGFTSLHSFDGTDGMLATGTLIQGGDGSLYGTTQGGGDFEGSGTVYRIRLAPSPSVTILPAGATTFCPGGSVSLAAMASGGVGGYAYRWYVDGGAIALATSSNYVATSSGIYTVVLTDSSMSTASSNAVAVTALPPPVITSSAGSNGSVTLTATGGTGYSWSKDGVPTGDIGSSLTVTQSGTYTVSAMTFSGCFGTSAPTAVTIVSTGQNVTATEGGVSATFSQIATSGPVSVSPIDPTSVAPLPAGYFQLGGGGAAYEISTGASYSGNITIGISLSGTFLLQAFNSIRILHGENVTDPVTRQTTLQLVDRTASEDVQPRNYSTLTIYAIVPSLSPFVLAQTHAPLITAVSGPIGPTAVGTPISVSGRFTDPDAGDSHSATWAWGDETSSAGTVVESTGSITGTHTYSTAGVYTVRLTVSDASGGKNVRDFKYAVIYDSSAGYVTGGGWINSPTGAYPANPALTGKANFGFVSKYQHGQSVPTGNTQFQFSAASFNFQSSVYEWLVISGAKARYRGTGTVNGSGSYGFELTAWDGQVSGGGGVDKFRIKIWDHNQGNAVVYDNQMGAPDGTDPTTVLGGGAIVIHSQ